MGQQASGHNLCLAEAEVVHALWHGGDVHHGIGVDAGSCELRNEVLVRCCRGCHHANVQLAIPLRVLVEQQVRQHHWEVGHCEGALGAQGQQRLMEAILDSAHRVHHAPPGQVHHIGQQVGLPRLHVNGGGQGAVVHKVEAQGGHAGVQHHCQLQGAWRHAMDDHAAQGGRVLQQRQQVAAVGL